ncbi:MAG: NAD(P)-dependent oxidoreductase [Deltaproteobacteria bacterium]|nr:NAD(P)-dependent oxidoreductase [Deltaproteobacteria bacterium]
MTLPETTKIGFIGTGVMGKSMARHLMKSKYPLHIYSRTKEKAKELIKEGAIWEESVAVLVAKCRIVFTIVGFPTDVEDVYLGDGGILNNISSGGYVIDMTTSQPQLAVKISAEAEKKGVSALDAPVSGGDTGARNGQLSIMVGGEEKAYETILPLFLLMGTNIVYQGPAGSGQHTKMCNQIVIAAGMMGVCEALAYAGHAGLDVETVLKSIESGAAGSWSLSNLGPRMIGGDFEPGFYVKHFIKDMIIASESAKSMNLETPGLDLAKSLYEKLAEQGGSDDGTQALFKIYGGK